MLLTSAGITNRSLADALSDLLGKPNGQTKIGFIPTAANVEPGNKEWFLRQLSNLQGFGFQWIDIIDISAEGVDWKGRFESVDCVVISGGNTFHLIDQIRKAGFGEWLYSHRDEKVVVGISAGTIVMTPSIAIASIDDGDKNLSDLTDFSGLGFINFEISPHTPEQVSHQGNRKYLEGISNELYAIDDQSGIKIENDLIQVVSEGEWLKY